MRKMMIVGAGAQGSTIAKRMQEEPSVDAIVNSTATAARVE